MKKLLGKPLADKILAETKASVETLSHRPKIRIIADNLDQPYAKGIIKDAKFCGIDIDVGHGSKTKLDGIISLNKDYTPYPEMDLDGGLMTPCTAEAIMELLKYYKVPLSGKRVCVIGRSPRVGRPLINLLINADATVTACHSKTEIKDIYWHSVWADVIISCVGGAGFDGDMCITHYTTVVDVGNDFIRYGDPNALVPFVGGVGPVTRAVLMRHAYEKAKEKEC